MAIQARTEFASALNQIASEKGVDVNIIIEAIEQAALAAYRKDLSLRGQEIPENFDSLVAKIDKLTGEIAIMDGEKNVTPPGFARIAAQTAKQVIMQRLHEAEKGAIMDEYDKKVGTIITGTIQRQEGNTYFVDLGRAEGIMPMSEQTRDEYYHAGQRLKFFIKEIREGGRGPEVIVSRSDVGLVKGLFAMEVPEIQAGSVVIKDIAREAGGRTKLSAISTQEGVDPVGSLVGQKGVRVQTVIQELGEEKIDIVSFSEDPQRYIASALSPAKDVIVELAENGDKLAKVKIPNSQLSLAIGKGGQNVRLAAKLTGYKIDIEGTEDLTSPIEEKVEESKESKEAEESKEPEGPEESKVEEQGTAEQEKQVDEGGTAGGSVSQSVGDSGDAQPEAVAEPEVAENVEADAVVDNTETPSSDTPTDATTGEPKTEE